MVVIRSNDNCFLDVMRCCGIAGIPVLPVVFTWEGAGPWYSEHSKYYQNPVCICNPAEDEAKAVQDLVNLGKSLQEKYQDKVLLIPTSDTSLVLIQKHFESLRDYFLQMGSPNFERSILELMSKDRFFSLMENNGLPIPKTYACLHADDIDGVLKQISFPCVYKPVLKDGTNSFYRTHKGLKAIECSDPQSLKDCLEREMRDGFQLVVQEKILFSKPEDEYSCYLYADKNQNVRMISGQYKLDEHPKPYGTGFLSRFYVVPEVFEIAKKVAKALKWRGFIGVEIMKDGKDGRWKIIEANTRPWLSIYFQASQGFNYVEFLYQDCLDELHGAQDCKTATRETNGEVFRINFGVFWKKLKSLYQPDELLRYLQQWFDEHKGRYVFSNYVWQDPEPGIREVECLIQREKDAYRGLLMLLLAFMRQSSPDEGGF